MTPAELVVRLSHEGVHLAVREGELRFSGPRSAIGPALLSELTCQRAGLIDLLTRTRFTRAELDTLGYRGTPAKGAAGLWVVTVGASIGALVMRLQLFGVRPVLCDGGEGVCLECRERAIDQALPPHLLKQAVDRAGELKEYAHERGWVEAGSQQSLPNAAAVQRRPQA